MRMYKKKRPNKGSRAMSDEEMPSSSEEENDAFETPSEEAKKPLARKSACHCFDKTVGKRSAHEEEELDEENNAYQIPPQEAEIPLAAKSASSSFGKEENDAFQAFAEETVATSSDKVRAVEEYNSHDEEELDEESGMETDSRDATELLFLHQMSEYSSILDYDISGMFPDMKLILKKPRHTWNYDNPEVIRAIWLEQKTNVLAEWKIRHSKRQMTKKPKVNQNRTTLLRMEYQEHKRDLMVALNKKRLELWEIGREVPYFEECYLLTNSTSYMRYHYNRNIPPVPAHIAEYYLKHKRPPFLPGTRTQCVIVSKL